MKAPSPRYFEEREAGVLECRLCPRHCRIQPGQTGFCGVRGNGEGRPVLPRYGHISALAIDPIEKKPLYHFRPGSGVLSLGFTGCNLRCPFCQNWRISQDPDAEGRFVPAEQITAQAKSAGIAQIAYTYSEPLVHGEYLLDCMTAAREAGIANVLVTNGSAEPEAAEEVLALADAANIDLKSFSPETYRKILGGDLETVKAFIRAALDGGVHVEITTLIVPGLNDSEGERENCADFIAGLVPRGSGRTGVSTGTGTDPFPPPWHLSACHPDWRWDGPPTEAKFLRSAAERARRTLPFVYTGNIGSAEDTLCAHCGGILVQRRGYRIAAEGLAKADGTWRCAHCGKPAPFRG